MHLYNKEDLARLKDSKPIQITAHTHECIVPVVYSGMVNRFLEKKGVHLPLTHHQLADMKREAGTPGYAKGTKDLKKKKGKGKSKAVNVSQNVVVNVTRPVRTSKAKGLYDQLRPSNYAMIRSTGVPMLDYAKAEREAKAKETDALEQYKKEVESRRKLIEQLQSSADDSVKIKAPLVASSSSPIRRNDFESFMERSKQVKDARESLENARHAALMQRSKAALERVGRIGTPVAPASSSVSDFKDAIGSPPPRGEYIPPHLRKK